jgi:hypothetical protein
MTKCAGYRDEWENGVPVRRILAEPFMHAKSDYFEIAGAQNSSTHQKWRRPPKLPSAKHCLWEHCLPKRTLTNRS